MCCPKKNRAGKLTDLCSAQQGSTVYMSSHTRYGEMRAPRAVIFAAVLYALCAHLPGAQCQTAGGFVHTTSGALTCVIGDASQNKAVLDQNNQYKVASEWTYNHKNIKDWSMSPWHATTSVHPFESSQIVFAVDLQKKTHFKQSEIVYETVVRLPKIMSTLLNVQQHMKIEKRIFVANNHIYTFVQIHNIPLIRSMYIDSVMLFLGNGRVASRHHVKYDDLPFMLQWVTRILKEEIVKGLDRVDSLNRNYYCSTA